MCTVKPACMFVPALFIIAETWKQPRCPPVVGNWINCDPPRKWNIIQH